MGVSQLRVSNLGIYVSVHSAPFEFSTAHAPPQRNESDGRSNSSMKKEMSFAVNDLGN